ncbi:hypothetical protein J3B02_006095, partial [Coemansia erecta]
TGINEDDELAYEEAAKLEIAKWQGANAKSVATAKQGHLSSLQMFISKILNEFVKM